MAIVTEELVIKVNADTKQADSKLGNLNTKTKKTASSFASMGLAVAAAGVALNKLAKFATKAIDLWAKQEKAILKNESALKAWGYNVAQGSFRLQKYTAEMQRLTNIDDDLILSLTSTAIAMGKTAKEAEDATTYAIGLSEAFGIDMKASLKAVALAQAGEFTQLQRYIPALRTATTETEKWEFINNATTAGLDAMAKATETAAGKVARLGNSWGDWLEQLGRGLTLNDLGVIGKLSDLLDENAAKANIRNAAMEQWNTLSKESQRQMGGLSSYIKTYTDNLSRTEYEMNKLAATTELVGQSLSKIWEPDKPREYWEAAFDGARLQYGALSELERIDIMRAQAIADTKTEFEDLNLELEEMINNYYDLEKAAIQDDAIASIRNAQDIWSETQQKLHLAELSRIEKEKQDRLTMIATVTQAWGASFSAVGNFIGQIFKIEAEGYEEGSKERKRALKKQAIAEKATAVFSSLINTAVAIVKSMPNPFLIAASATLGAIQTAGILATPVPSFALGTSPSGYQVPEGYSGDNYPVMAKSGETVHVEREGNSSNEQYLNNYLSIDGYQFGKIVTRLIADRKISMPRSA